MKLSKESEAKNETSSKQFSAQSGCSCSKKSSESEESSAKKQK